MSVGFGFGSTVVCNWLSSVIGTKFICLDLQHSIETALNVNQLSKADFLTRVMLQVVIY